jgi:hypothetical protein
LPAGDGGAALASRLPAGTYALTAEYCGQCAGGRYHESARFAAALKARNIPVEYAVYAEAGHYLTKQSDILDYYRRAEKFLAKYLGPGQPD